MNDFLELQITEMRTYVQAELAPVHDSFRQLSSIVGPIVVRMGRLESRDSGIAGNAKASAPDDHDTALRQVAFIEFLKESSAE